jgi:uncharacterized protein YdeI (YjbR/CyaY-like superfamily)
VSPKKPDLPLLEVPGRAELRAWLEQHAATSPGVRLAIGKKGNAVTTLSYEDAVEEGVAFGWIDSTAGRLDADRFTVLFTPRKPGSMWAKSNKDRVERLTAAGLMAPRGMAAVSAAKADGSWDLLSAIDDLVVPPDLATGLAAEPDAAAAFEARSASERRMALYWIASAKRAETPARRVSGVVSAIVARGPMPPAPARDERAAGGTALTDA